MKIMTVLAGLVLMIAYCVIGTSDMAQAEEVLGFQIGEIEYFGDANLTPVEPKAKFTTTWGRIKNAR